MGHIVTVDPAPAGIANPVMILCDPATGALEAAGDPLSGRHAGALP